MRWPATLCATLVLFGPIPAWAQTPIKACQLLSASDLAIAGTRFAGKLFDDDSTLIRKGELPGIGFDLQIDQCHSEVGAHGIVPVRLSLAQTRDAISRRGWEDLNRALDKDEKPSKGVISEALKVDGNDCEYLSWPTRASGTRIHQIGCTAYLARHLVTLEFNDFDRAKLPSAQTVSSLLGRSVARIR